MKKLRRYVSSSKYIEQSDEPILFDDVLIIDIDVDLSQIEASSNLSKFPGLEQFRKDVINILENEYGFEVIEDNYNGKRQKGHFSNRPGSISLYLDTYYDLANAPKAISKLRLSETETLPAGKVYCYIHFRISDHELYDQGDPAHIKYLNDNANKYATRKPNVNLVEKEETFVAPESNFYQNYEDTLEDFRIDLDARILAWVRKAERYIKPNLK